MTSVREERPTDAELLSAHLNGDPSAFERLTSRYVDELFGFVIRFVNHASTAEDIVQDTFLQVHLAADSFDPKRAFKPWLYTIAANKARDHLRARSRKPMQSLDAGGPGDERRSAAETLPDLEPGALEQLDEQERHALVRELVHELPDNLREILLLGYFQKLPYAEIAEILEIPVGTVKSRLHAAVHHFAGLWRARVERSGDRVER